MHIYLYMYCVYMYMNIGIYRYTYIYTFKKFYLNSRNSFYIKENTFSHAEVP